MQCLLQKASAQTCLPQRKLSRYPVPFNPHQQILTVNYQSGGTAAGRIMFEVFDINGDRVFSGDYSSFPIKWGGYASSGSRVKPGMYIIKVRVENITAGY